MADHDELLARHREQWSGKQHHGLTFGDINTLVELQAAAIRDLQAQLKIQDDANDILTRDNAELKAKLEAMNNKHAWISACQVTIAELQAKLEAERSERAFDNAAWKRDNARLKLAEAALAKVERESRELKEGWHQAHKAVFADTVERCAKVCDDQAAELQPYAERNYNAEDAIARGCAAAIRALAPETAAGQESSAAQMEPASNAKPADAAAPFDPRKDPIFSVAMSAESLDAAAPGAAIETPRTKLEEYADAMDGNCHAVAYRIIEELERDLNRLRTACLAIAKRIRNEGMQGVANELEEIAKS